MAVLRKELERMKCDKLVLFFVFVFQQKTQYVSSYHWIRKEPTPHKSLRMFYSPSVPRSCFKRIRRLKKYFIRIWSLKFAIF